MSVRKLLHASLAWGLTLWAVHAGGAASVAQEIVVEAVAGAEEIEPGKAFPLSVVRAWSTQLEPEAWNDESLAPLSVRLLETTRREEIDRVEETLRFECYAFILEDIEIPGIVFRARSRDDGSQRVALSDEITIRVRPALDPEAPGSAEMPGDLLPLPPSKASWWGFAVAGFVGLALLVGYLRMRQRRPDEETKPVEAPIGPHVRALERLQRLCEHDPQGYEEIQIYYVEASALMREYIGDRFEVRAPEMTTKEFLEAPQTADAVRAPHRDLLSKFLTHCDIVKFSRYMPTVPDRERILEAASKFLQETSNGELSQTSAPPLPEGSDAA